jgi:hydroxymethylbilane synthase
LRALNDEATHQAALAERALLRGLGGGCQVPIGAASAVHAGRLRLRGVVLPPDGSRRVADEAEGAAADAEAVGRRLAEALLARGARELLTGGGH